MKTISFIGVGPQRTASSWLHQMLSAHTGIAFPHQVKETMFFDQHYAKGLDWYLWHFRKAKPDQLLGEIAPTYFGSDFARANIRRNFPEAKIIINVRNPIVRAHSMFRHHLSKGRVANDFMDAVRCFPEILESGRYHLHAPAWEVEFSGKVLYVLNEDIEADPAAALEMVCDFIDVAQMGIPPDAMARINTASAPRSKMVARLLSNTVTTLHAARLHSVVELGKRAGLNKLYRGGPSPDPMTQEQHAFLADYFAKDIQWVEHRLGRDLSNWLSYPTPKATANDREAK